LILVRESPHSTLIAAMARHCVGGGPCKRRSAGPAIGEETISSLPPSRVTSVVTPAVGVGGGPRPEWMKGIPTPFTAASCLALHQGSSSGCSINSESARLAELVAIIGEPHAPSDRLLPPLVELRQLLSTQLSPPIQQFLDLGGLPSLLSLLTAQSAAIQLEAAWAITNVAYGSCTQLEAVVEAGGHLALLKALQSPAVSERADLCSQILWALCNIASDKNSQFRDRLLESDVIGHIGQLFAQMPSFSWDSYGRDQVLRKQTGLMSSLCGGYPAPKLEGVDCAFDYFVQVVIGTDDVEMSSDAFWGLHHLLHGATSSEDGDKRAARMLVAGFGDGEGPPANVPHPLLVKLVSSVGHFADLKSTTVAPALKILGALVSVSVRTVLCSMYSSVSDVDVTDLVLHTGALKVLVAVLAGARSPSHLRKDAAWALSNIAAGSAAHARRLLEEPGAYDTLKAALEHGPSQEVRHECTWALVNLTNQGALVLSLVDWRELLRLLSLALTASKQPVLQCALLDALEAVLSSQRQQQSDRKPEVLHLSMQQEDGKAAFKGVAENHRAKAAEGFGLLSTLEKLQFSDSQGVYQKAVQMLEQFFRADAENEPPEVPVTPSAAQRLAMKSPATTPSSAQRHLTVKSPATTPSAICGGSPVRPGYKFGA